MSYTKKECTKIFLWYTTYLLYQLNKSQLSPSSWYSLSWLPFLYSLDWSIFFQILEGGRSFVNKNKMNDAFQMFIFHTTYSWQETLLLKEPRSQSIQYMKFCLILKHQVNSTQTPPEKYINKAHIAIQAILKKRNYTPIYLIIRYLNSLRRIFNKWTKF